MKVGRRLAIKLLNASRFALGSASPQGSITHPVDCAMLRSVAGLVDEATRNFEAYDYARVLQRTEVVEGAPSIPYAVDLDGQPVDLTTVWSRIVDPPRNLQGLSLPMSLTLGEVAGRVAGRYADLITIDVSPN